jgi:hypothetical protein
MLPQGVRQRKTAHVEIVCMNFEYDAKTKHMLGHAVLGQNLAAPKPIRPKLFFDVPNFSQCTEFPTHSGFKLMSPRSGARCSN